MRTRWWIIALLGALSLALVGAGCGGDDEAAEPETPDTPAEAEEEEREPFEIAYLSASSANTWLLSSKRAMDEVAGERGANITEFDAEFNPELQTRQLQDVIASGRYDGIVISVIVGPAIIPDIEAALEAGLKVAVLNQVLGDRFDTADPQVDGVSVSVLAPPRRSGERFGSLALQACEGKDPCRVVYFYGIRGIPLDVAIKEGFDEVIAENPAIEIVAEGEGQYLGPDVGVQQMQDILQTTSDFDVVIGSDQSMQGVQQALADAGMLDRVAIIGLGGSEAAITAIAEGHWFGGVFGAPYTEGRLAMEGLMDALENDVDVGGIDPLTHVPDEGLVTQDNVGSFEPEWAG
jgi:ribose transport system substrate-binding protein